MKLTINRNERFLKSLPEFRDLYDLALKLILEYLDQSDYDASMKHQMLCRINRILGGVVSDNNPESKILDGGLYAMGLELILQDPRVDNHIRRQAEDMLDNG